MTSAFEDIGNQWKDDAFDRESYAGFLTRYLVGKTAGTGRREELKPFTIALDAEWGTGKTFFLQRWAQDLRSSTDSAPPHVVICFDAWASDYADDPLIAFIAELRSELTKALHSSGLAATAKVKAIAALNTATKNARHIALPIAGAITKALIKKATAIDIDKIAEIINGDEDEDESEDQTDGAKTPDADASALQAEEAIDRFFKIQLDEHEKRKNAIAAFKHHLSIVLDTLQSAKKAKPPIFILVDELDRCKPSFAIGLLETIKHIFGIPGVCIVVATNVDQLSHTICAVYGQGFDSSTYLQRFFDATYMLPSGSGPQLLKTWMKERPIFLSDRCAWPETPNGFDKDTYGPGIEGLVTWILQGMNLSLREQFQILELAETAALGMSDQRRIHMPWLLLVCIMWHSHRQYFFKLTTSASAGSSANEIWSQVIMQDTQRTYSVFTYPTNERRSINTNLIDLASAYCSRASADLISLSKNHNHDSVEFHNLVESQLLKDAPRTYPYNSKHPANLLEYFTLVRTAGHLKQD